MGELSETTMVKGVAECSACGGSGGVVELVTGWGSVRPACEWARRMGLLGAPAVRAMSSQGIYVFGSTASVAVVTHEHLPEAPEWEVLT